MRSCGEAPPPGQFAAATSEVQALIIHIIIHRPTTCLALASAINTATVTLSGTHLNLHPHSLHESQSASPPTLSLCMWA